MSTVKKILVTGGAGQIAYSLLFSIAKGNMLGKTPIELSILDLPEMQHVLEGVKMELEDGAFPLLHKITVGSDPYVLAQGADVALLVGAKPRGPGMERGELLKENGKIFIAQGQALNAGANPNCIVLVVGNPCNTNAWIALKNAPRLKPENFHAMTRLDQNRAAAQLALKAGVPVSAIEDLVIWGNHSSTQVPDFEHAKIQGKPVVERIQDKAWLEGSFTETVRKRGAAIIAARGKSSAASAANAAVDAIRALFTPGEVFSSGIYSAQNPYGIDPDLIYSFPCRSLGQGRYEWIRDWRFSEALKEKLKLSEKELQEERESL